jgi:geranylgeranyl pyrophosphate synthase
LIEALIEKLESLWKSTGAWPEYKQVMRLALSIDLPESASSGMELSRWARLPGLCCQAAGGDPEWAGELTLAWLLFYSAAHLMDKVQDGDEPDPWWAEAGPGIALSAASGLYFSASLALYALHDRNQTQRSAPDVIRRFLSAFLIMGGGQFSDLTRPIPTLEEYWQQVELKSGAFFSMACWGGARLATEDERMLDAYARFGHHLGLLIQIQDDLEDVRATQNSGVPGQNKQFKRSLPVVYALEISAPAQSRRLQECLEAAPNTPDAAYEAIAILDAVGAASYIQIEMERHKSFARRSLETALARPPALESLKTYIDSL